MTSSKDIAGLIGPTLMALTTTEVANLRIWATGIPAVIYLNGTLLFVAGLSIVRVHNRWSLRWPLVVTLVGWFALLGGLFRMFYPRAPQGDESLPTFGVMLVLFATGVFLTYKAYGPKHGSSAGFPNSISNSA